MHGRLYNHFKQYGLAHLIFIVGLLLRTYFALYKDTSYDEAVFYGNVVDPLMYSLFSLNYPPLFVGLFKSIHALFGELDLSTYRILVLSLSIFTYSSLFQFFKKNKYELWCLLFLALNPASIVACSQFQPAVLMELFGTMIFLSLNSGVPDSRPNSKASKALLVFSFLGLLFTTWAALALPVFLLFESTLRDRKYLRLVSAGILIGILFLISQKIVLWKYLEWIQSLSILDSFFGGLTELRNFYGYSWIQLGVVAAILMYSKKGRVVWTFVAMSSLILMIYLGLGIKSPEPRFLIFLNPWAIFIYANAVNSISGKKGIAALLVVGLVTQASVLQWFLLKERSGIDVLSRYIQEQKIDTVYVQGYSASIMAVFGKQIFLTLPITNTGCKKCAIIAPPNLSHEEIEDGVKEVCKTEDFNYKTFGEQAIQQISLVEFSMAHCKE